MCVEANLIGCINELHTLVGDGEDNGGDFSHLFRRPLKEKIKPRHYRCNGDLPFTRTSCNMSPHLPTDFTKKAETYPHFGTGVLRGLRSSQILNEHGTEILHETRSEVSVCGQIKVHCVSRSDVNVRWLRTRRTQR